MKSNSLCLVAFILSMLLSCKKENDSTSITYTIDEGDQYITGIMFRDQAANMVNVNSVEAFGGNSKTIKISKKPFTAAITIQMNNSTNSAKAYGIRIAVNGEMKVFSLANCPPFSEQSSGELQYVIE